MELDDNNLGTHVFMDTEWASWWWHSQILPELQIDPYHCQRGEIERVEGIQTKTGVMNKESKGSESFYISDHQGVRLKKKETHTRESMHVYGEVRRLVSSTILPANTHCRFTRVRP